jgi:hypothetical protein
VKDTIENIIKVIAVDPIKRKKGKVMKDAWKLETLRSIGDSQFQTHLRFHLLKRERSYMLEFIKWNILMNKSMLNPKLIKEIKSNIVQTEEEDQWMEETMNESVFTKEFMPLMEAYLNEVAKADKKRRTKLLKSEDIPMFGSAEESEDEFPLSFSLFSIFNKAQKIN